jgi:hypothetical protein
VYVSWVVTYLNSGGKIGDLIRAVCIPFTLAIFIWRVLAPEN